MIELQQDILTETILSRVEGTSLGHCVRVDFLGSDEALALCRRLSARGTDLYLTARILVPDTSESVGGEFAITTDQAIALRNRKQTHVCLFVPANMVDAAVSSLGNSFVFVDGRELHSCALRELLARLPSEGQQIWRAVSQRLHRPLNASVDRQLDFVGALHTLNAAETLARAGLDLWRVGLIADSRPDFLEYLDKNRECVRKLTRPGKIHATTAERIQALGVDSETATALAGFFRNRALHDPTTWSRDLANGQGPTLESWIFPLEERSNIQSVTVRPFIGPDGLVGRYCNLAQPEGPGGSLRARCGLKEKMTVRWVTDPPTPANLGRWRVEMTSSGGEPLDDLDFDLPALDIAGSRRSCTVKLDLEFEEPPDFGLCIRVSALDTASNILRSADTDELVCAESDEFFLVSGPEPPMSDGRQTRRTVPAIAFGRLEAAVETRGDVLTETQPQWIGQNTDYFTLRLNERRILNIGTVSTLVTIQRRVIGDPRTGGSFEVDLDELRPIRVDDVKPRPFLTATLDAWAPFWRAREAFFARLKKAAPRDVVETADWSPELAAAASRYAQTYRDLLDDLVNTGAPRHILLDALTVDSVLIRLATSDSVSEDALLLLPTHPMRSVWFAGYSQLLRTWETQILQQPPRERKGMVDLDAVRQLAPINVPAFAFHATSSSPFVFFQNLRFFYGVALPPDIADAHRRLADVALMLNVQSDFVRTDDRHPDRLADYLKSYLATHPYADALTATLVNADDSGLFTEAVRRLLQTPTNDEETEEHASAPVVFQVTSYVEDERHSSGLELEGIRQAQLDLIQTRKTDHLLPGLTTTIRVSASLQDQPLPDAHLTLISDLSRPRVLAAPLRGDAAGEVVSLTLYGLIARLVQGFSIDEGELRWLHRLALAGAGRPEPHPSGAKYTDALVDLHAAWQRAGNSVLGGQTGAQPALEVTLSPEQQRLLEQLHEHSDWVITLDRFFPLDYYDSPNEPYLSKTARKYVLDYAPEFGEGLSHRMMLTTGSRNEIGSLLGRAMNELGFAAVDQSVRQLLQYLKTVSGRLALQALGSSTGAAAAVGLGVVTAWLQNRGRLGQAVLVPVDLHPQLFSNRGSRGSGPGDRRCDLVLFALKRNIVEASFIEVKWRRGLASLDNLAEDMLLQMEASAQAIRERFFNENRVDGALHRAALSNVLRFYFDRARRYRLFDETAEAAFLDNLGRLERTRAEFRASYEGYIVSLEDAPRKPLSVGDAKITILTAQDFESSTEFHAEPKRVAGPDEPAEQDNATADKSVPPPGSVDKAVDTGREGTLGVPTGVAPVAETGEQIGDTSAPLTTREADEIHVPLGETAAGTRVEWLPSIKGSPHIFIIGIPGQGKSWTTMRILAELGAQHVPALVLDFHGQFSDPLSAFMRAANPTVLDAAAGLPFTPFECSPTAGIDDWKANAYAVSEIFAYVAGLGDMQRDVVYTTVRDAYRNHGFDRGFGGSLTYPTMEEILRAIEEGERARRVANVSARLRPLLEMELFQPPDSPPNLLTTIRNGLVIDVHNLYVETVQLAVGAFVLRKLYKDMFRWGVASSLRLAVVLDEAHRLAKDITLPKVMKEGRKFGVAVVVASQGLGDFHQDVLGNAGTKVIFRVNYPESRRIAGFIRSRQGQDLAERIEQLPVGSAYVQTPEMPFGSVIRMYPPE
jgi:DNA phosphorothioation-dependent restriction protein DptH